MRTILALIEGNDSDPAILQTAFAIAEMMTGHVDVLHVDLAVGDAIDYASHADFARGVALRDSLQALGARAAGTASAARQAFAAFCARNDIAESGEAARPGRVSARWHSGISTEFDRLIQMGRHRDLVIAGHPSSGHAWPSRLIETLLTQTGRPLLLLPKAGALQEIDTVTVCWKEDAASARALTAAMPILRKSKTVTIVTVREDASQTAESGKDLSAQLAWHGIDASTEFLWDSGEPAISQLRSAAAAHSASLMVMGAFSHSRTRELLFGGCTQAVLDGVDRPVFLLH